MEHELFDASIHGRTQDVEEMLHALSQAGLSTPANVMNRQGQTPLRLAAYQGHADTVELLIAEGATVDDTSFRSRTPLWEASSQGHVETVDILIDKGHADLDAPNQYGWTPLHIASWNGYADTVQHLLEAGANVNQMDHTKENTALHYVASFHSHVHIANLLLDYGADLTLKNHAGKTALDLATESESNIGMQTTLLMHQVMQPKHGFLNKQKRFKELQCQEGDEGAEQTALQEEQDNILNKNKQQETASSNAPPIVVSINNQTNFLSRMTGGHSDDSSSNIVMASNTLLIVGIVEVIVLIVIIVGLWVQKGSSKMMTLRDKKEK